MEKLIMLIDDDSEELDIMNEALGKGDIMALCVWAQGCDHALRLLKQVMPDYIFIDINMPIVNGLACLEELKRDEKLAHIPMVMYSTYINDDTRKKAKEKGAICCMQKPDNVFTLVHQLTAFLKVKTAY